MKKKCPYCGTEYEENLQSCPIDGYTLKEFATKPVRTGNLISNQVSLAAIGPAGRWLVFAGLPFSIASMLFVGFSMNSTVQGIVGQTALPYVLFFVPVGIVLFSRVLYEKIPKRSIIPLGFFGWLLGGCLMCWFFWSGPSGGGY